MRRALVTLCAVLLMGAVVGAGETWGSAYKRGDYAAAAALLQQAVFELPPSARSADPAALKQLGLLYAEGKGVTADGVLACGLLRAHAAAIARTPRSTRAAIRAAQSLVERYCVPLTAAERAAAFAAMSCPRIGLDRDTPIVLDTDWSIRFKDRSVIIVRGGESREQPLPGDLVCRSQVLLLRHSALEATDKQSADKHKRTPGARHVIEQVTVQSAWRGGVLTREIVWQLYEVRGLTLDLAAVQRWQEPGSAWPAPPLPDALARGVSFVVRGTGEIDYTLDGRVERVVGGR